MQKLKTKLFKNKLIIDSFWALLGNVFFKGLSLAAGIVVARMLGKDIFGEFSIIKATFISIAFITTFGFGYTTTKFVADLKENKPEKLKAIFLFTQKSVLRLTILASIIVVFCSKPIALNLLKDITFSFHIKLVSVLIILNSLNFLYVGFLSGLGLFKKMAKINFFIGFLTFFLTVSLTYYFGLYGALSALVLVQLVSVLINNWLINNNIPNKGCKNDIKLNKELILFSLPIALQETVYAVMSWVINFLIVLYVSFGEFGMYTAAIQLNAIVLFIPGILRNVVLSHLSKNSNNNKKHGEVLNTIVIINTLATLIPSIIVFIFSDFVASTYGKSFIGLSDLIKVSIFTTIFASISNVYAQAYMSKNMNWVMLLFRTIRDGGIISLFLYLINQNNSGAESMIYSNLILNAIFMVLMIIFYKFKIAKTSYDN